MTTTHVIPKNRTVYYEDSIVIITCSQCCVDFGLGADFQRRRRADHGTFYCPNGHSQYYPQDNAEEKLRKEKEHLEARLRSEREYTERERQRRLTAERQRAAAKGQVTKIKNRVSKGVCPCCNRSFVNVARHMAGQHPEYTGSDQ
jgi:hypothetical protein